MFWDGTRWVDERAPAATPPPTRRRARDWLATSVVIVGIAALAIPFVATSAASSSGDRLIASWSGSFQTRVFQESTVLATYAGTWVRQRDDQFLGSYAAVSTRVDAVVDFTFRGSGVSWVGPKGPNQGRARVYLDGRYVRTVDNYSQTPRPRESLFTASFPAVTQHTLTIHVLASTARRVVTVDALAVRGPKLTETGAQMPAPPADPTPVPPAAAAVALSTPAAVPAPTASPASTATARSAPTVMPTLSQPATPMPTDGPTSTPVGTTPPTASPRATATPTATPKPTPTPTPTPSVFPSASLSTSPSPSPSLVASASTYTFDDEFTGSSLDPTKWMVDETFTNLSLESDNMSGLSQVSVANSVLTIRCERGVTPSGRAWRSGVIATKGLFSQLYGDFAARIWYTKGDGLWPAFWLLDATTEGTRPELDVMEAYPNTSDYPGSSPPAPWPGPNRYSITEHYRDANGVMHSADSIFIDAGTDLTTGWHTFEMEWRAGLLVSRLDGVEMARITTNVPSVPMFLILDHVVGSWNQLSTASTPSPADMLVDWVRVKP